MCGFLEKLDVPIVIITVAFISLVGVRRDCISICFFFPVSEFCCSPSFANVVERAGTRRCAIYHTRLEMGGIGGLRLKR